MNILRKLYEPVDMTSGTPWKKILLFTIPMLIGNITQQLYNTVDSIVVGKYVGDNALAAVGSAGPIVNLLICLFVGISMGASITVSQFLGAKRREALSHTIGNCLILILISTVIIMVAGTLVTRPLLIALHTPESILDWCTNYLHIMFWGAAGLSFYNILSGVLRGLGDSMAALLYLVIASILNIFLDLFFVRSFHMGVAGVALATVIAQAISAVFCLHRLYSMRNLFDMNRSYIKWDKQYAMNIIRLGIPSGITQAILSMAMILVQSLTNTFGEQFIAANVITMRVDGFAMLPNMSFGTAMTTYAGQNVGAGDYYRVTKGARQGTILAMGVTTAITGLILLFGHTLMGLFTNTQELIDIAVHLIRILAVGYIAMAVLQCLSGVMRGAGDTMTPMWISIFQTLGVRVVLAYLFVHLTKTPELPQGDRNMIYVSLLCAWVIGMLVTCFFYFKGDWKKKALK